MRVLIASSEVAPFAKTGGLGDVCGSLPRALQALGHEVHVAMPMYAGITPDEGPLRTMEVPIGYERRGCAVYLQHLAADLPVYLIDHKAFYDRPRIYGTNHGDYPDNAERFAYFSRAVCELARLHLPEIDIVHVNDWQTAMIPVLLRTHYATERCFYGTGTLLTIHNMGYQGSFPKEALHAFELGWKYFTPDCLEYNDRLNFLKGGIVFSDLISTVSRRYAHEIQTREFGYGLDGLLRHRGSDLVGILNGADYSEWDPATDRNIAASYHPGDLSGKRACKRELLREFGLYPDYSGPVIGIISRLADQKGFDLIARIAYRLLELDCVLTVLGSGEPRYEELFRTLAEVYSHRVGTRIAVDNGLAHRIEAGADMFLMPSKYEPCGLNQIYSLKYGTIPIVRATGGLDDTIEDFNFGEDSGTGFKFYAYDGEDLFYAIARAVATYQDRELWTRMMQRAMSRDFSWGRSARHYEETYGRAIEQHRSFVHS